MNWFFAFYDVNTAVSFKRKQLLFLLAFALCFLLWETIWGELFLDPVDFFPPPGLE